MIFGCPRPSSLPDRRARTGYGPGMAPVRVRGCAGHSKPPGTPEDFAGKPMPGAGETAHVRRLFVDRSRCALEVSPAPLRVPMSLMTGRRAVVAFKSGDTLSRRMWGRRPGRPDGWHADVRGFVVPGATAPGVRAPTRSFAAPRPPCSGAVPGRDALHSEVRATTPSRLRWGPETVFRSSVGLSISNAMKVLIRNSRDLGKHVRGAGDDPASDGYTHFQASRAPAEAGHRRKGADASYPSSPREGSRASLAVAFTTATR